MKDTIDIEELLKDFKIMDCGSLKAYLKDVFKVKTKLKYRT